ncbi:PQQ-binding-like beta-propeller repeat protein, partial [Candidatus Neomarinimicrobiota bacterium]
ILSDKVVFAGGEGLVVAVDAETGKELWTSKVEGKACGLAATGKELLVSTDNGNIYCFAEGKVSAAKEVKPVITPSPFREDDLSSIYESAAEAIVGETGIKSGYCLVTGAGTGRLAFELAKRTELKIVGIEADREKVEIARKRLDEAGLYGSRIVIESWELSTLPDYFANLIVSDKILISGEIEGSSEEMFRVLKPLGGVAYFGQPVDGATSVKSVDRQSLVGWLRSTGAPEPEVTQETGIWAKVTRGELEGAGSWTEQYGNPQNTASSDDELVKGQLGVLWYGAPGPQRMVERHARAASPVSINGRLFIQGEEVIMAYDAYNGTPLWEKEIPGAVRVRVAVDGGNLVVTEDALYVAAFDKCYRLNPATGETVRVYEIPSSSDGSPRRWGYISCTGNTLYGSTAIPLKNEYAALWKNFVENGKWKNIDEIPSEYRMQYTNYINTYDEPNEKARADFQRSGALWRLMTDFPGWENYNPAEGAVTENIMVSDKVFAMDTETGKLLWAHSGKRIAHITISIGDGKIFFAESAVSENQKKSSLAANEGLIRRGIYEEADGIEVEYEYTDVRRATALDAATGKVLWDKSMDLTGCGGDNMASIYNDGVLLFIGSMGSHDAWRWIDSTLTWKRIAALSADNGDVIWSRPINYRTRPLIVGDKIIIEPRACDFRTGEIIMRDHPITGEQVPWEFLRPGHTCAITSASMNSLFYRSHSTAMYDLAGDRGVTIFGAIRPGCWINMIPANGLLLFPEASSGCTCSFPLRTTVVLKPKPERVQPWAVFITHGAMTPAKHFAINLGAPADMKDDEGTVWFGYPNPVTDYDGNHFPDYGVKFDLREKAVEGMGYFCSDFRGTTIEGSDKPWLFTSGFLGPLQCEVPLINDELGEESGVYTVRLGFSAPLNDQIGRRVFNVMLQGESVLKDFDILKDAGAPNRAVVKEFKGIKVDNVLAIELASKKTNPTIAQAPIINFIQVLREDGFKVASVSYNRKSN